MFPSRSTETSCFLKDSKIKSPVDPITLFEQAQINRRYETNHTMKHGGDIAQASAIFGSECDGCWLDLSTGIAPRAYPVPPISAHAWQRLPQSAALSDLLAAAKHAYRVPHSAGIAAAPGTQMLIQLLPLLYRNVKRVRILGPTYSEHQICWQRHVADTEIAAALQDLDGSDAAVITNPNNPDGRIVDTITLMERARQHTRDGTILIVDEAFADTAPEISIVPHAGEPGLIVLRSFGKFYGLAGLRLGFAIGHPSTIEELETALGPWAVSGPACEVAVKALWDTAWAAAARADYERQAARLDHLLERHGLESIGGTSLFRLARHSQAPALHDALARRGILSRKFEDCPTWLRFGLPGSDANFSRLDETLTDTLQMLQG